MIDILIPLYKNETYIKDCIESIKKQTYKNYHVYIIDDGSPDNSYNVVKELIKDDSRFSITTRENRGVSTTRQELIDLSANEYIMFIDSDDYLYEDTTLEKMINAIKQEQSDILISTIVKKLDNKTIINRDCDGAILTVDNKKALEDLFYIRYNGPSLIASIFKRKVFENVKFVPGIIYEDAEIVYKLMLNSNKITYYNIPTYVYIIKDDSIMRTAFAEKNMVLIKISNDILEDIKKNYPELEEAAIYSLINNMLELLRLKVLSNHNYDDKKQIIKEIRKYKKNILNNPNSRKGKKIQVAVASLGEFWYKMLMVLYVRILHKL
jgi:glycosyltransferase involved in cell wall biosynthesis